MLNRIISGVMIVGGALTMTMLYAAFAPEAALQRFFGEGAEGAALTIVAPNWGVLIAFMGALLIYGALHRPSRDLALVVAGASKVAFIALVLGQGDRYMQGLGAAVIVDSVMVVLFTAFLLFARKS